MGGTAFNISQGKGLTNIDLSQIQKGDEPFGIMSILSKAMVTIAEVNGVLEELRSQNGLIDKSATLLDNAGSAANAVDALAVGTKAEITTTLAKIETLTDQVKQVVNSNAGNVNSVLDKTPGTINHLNRTLDSLQVLSSRLGNTLDGVNQGRGTAGRLLTDEELYSKLLNSVTNLDLLVQDIKAHPKKYLKISLF
jgi:phospholipid/cholesterol/gamma-HCH transport system substrate-binding protein